MTTRTCSVLPGSTVHLAGISSAAATRLTGYTVFRRFAYGFAYEDGSHRRRTSVRPLTPRTPVRPHRLTGIASCHHWLLALLLGYLTAYAISFWLAQMAPWSWSCSCSPGTNFLISPTPVIKAAVQPRSPALTGISI